MSTEADRNSFQQILATKAQAWHDARGFAQWDPPDGDYMFRVHSIMRGVTEEGGMQWWRINGVIENHTDPASSGHDWSPFFFTDRWLGFIKDYLSATVGTVPENPVEADNLLDQTVGFLLLVNAATVFSKKSGKNVTNKSILRTLEKVQAVQAA